MVYLQHWHGWCYMKLLPFWRVLCTPYNHVPCHFMQSHISKVHECLAVPCHLHFWQNDQDLLHATAVHRGGTDTETRAQIVDPALLQGFEHMTFQPRVRCSTTEISLLHIQSCLKIIKGARNINTHWLKQWREKI